RGSHSGRWLDHQPAARDALNLPRHRPQRKDIAAHRLLREVFFDIADLAALRLDDDIIVAGLGYGSSGDYRRQPRAAAGSNPAIGPIEENLWSCPLNALGQFSRHFFDQASQASLVKIAKIVGAPKNPKKLRFTDVVFFGSNRDYLLGRNVDTSCRNLALIKLAMTNGAHSGSAFEQIVYRHREEPP